MKIDVTAAARHLGYSGLGALMLAISEKKISSDTVDDAVEAGIFSGEIPTQPSEAAPRLPEGSPVEQAIRASQSQDRRSSSESSHLAQKGATAQFDRLLANRTDAYVNAGVPIPRVAHWAALNDLCNDDGDLGVVARAVRLGYVEAILSSVERFGSDELKLKYREWRRATS